MAHCTLVLERYAWQGIMMSVHCLTQIYINLTTEEQTMKMVETAVTLVMDKDAAQKKKYDKSEEM